MHWKYTLPSPSYDRSNVHGTILSLFQSKDPRFCTALEVIAGPKLNHVVVKDKQSAKPLNEFKVFKNKTTIIPLKEVWVQTKNPEEIWKLEEENGVKAALSVISFNKTFEKVMFYTFGFFFICNDSATARRLSTEKKLDCVTIDGEIYWA